MECSAPPIWLKRQVEDPRVVVGDYTYFDRHISLELFTDNDRIDIGKFCSFAKNVVIFGGGNHITTRATVFPFRWLSETATTAERHSDTAHRGATVIGNDVWLGYGATVLSGITIGDGAVIGARAVVTKDVPAYAIAVGNPARVVRFRFQPATIERLLQLSWWNWEPEKIAANLELLYSNPDGWPHNLILKQPQSKTLNLLGR